MYYDQNSYPDQSQGSYDSMVYQTEVDSDQNADRNYSANDVVVAAQERLARQGYYHGETDGTYTPEMQKAVKNYQITNGLRPSGYLDADTLSVMGLQNSGY
jgi:peptidoglycan hydrolase-like protein with peptidoglycan-binding domain